MSARVNVVVVGAGRMGSVHARLIAGEVPEARLVAIADVDGTAAARLADELGVAASPDPAEAIAAPGVDAVVVAVSSSRHVEVVSLAAAAGRDVLCEKPLALTIEGHDEGIAVANRAGTRLQVGFMRRWDDDYVRAHEAIGNGDLGRTTLFKSLQFDADPIPPSFRDPAVSGGIFVDMGIHEFDLARWLMGSEVVRVHAFGSAVVDEDLGRLGDVDNAVVDLLFADGAVGSVELSRNAAYGEDVRTEVVGSAGSAFVGGLPATRFTLGRPGELVAAATPTTVPRFRDALVAQARAFVRAIADDRPVSPDGADSRAALEIALAARRSLESGEPVDVGAQPLAIS
ncbi:MAG TPA: Gfo/Idh/MocA family oxidoreductase [Candidatus Limnocylindrales bacterium]|nr:Gfo/Idh/MocA family oxidoreductase [Candidatus Limnocylindrales bacterium]